MPEDQSIYNIVTLKNIDDEDFVFAVDKQQYVIPAGEARNFPKFMARLALKHLTDKVLQKEDPEGRTLGNQNERDRVGSKILIGEEHYERPVAPTDADIIEEINRPSDMERLLEKNKDILKTQEPPVKTTDEDIIIPKPEPIKEEAEEEFEGLEEVEPVNETPSREDMIKYAKDTLLMNVDHHMTRKKLDKFSDEELYKELGMGDK